MQKVIAIAGSLALVLVMAVPVAAHPQVPPQSVCVLPEASADGAHEAYSHLDGVAAHVLLVKSPHHCEG